MRILNTLAVLAFAAISLLAAEKTASLINGKCSVCMEEHEKSTVSMDGMAGAAVTTMYCGNGHYDEDGKFVPPPQCNTVTYVGQCSRGHRIVQSEPR